MIPCFLKDVKIFDKKNMLSIGKLIFRIFSQKSMILILMIIVQVIDYMKV